MKAIIGLLALIVVVLFAAVGSLTAQPLDLAVSFDSNTSYSSITPADEQVAARNTSPAWLIDLAAMTVSFPASANRVSALGARSAYVSSSVGADDLAVVLF